MSLFPWLVVVVIAPCLTVCHRVPVNTKRAPAAIGPYSQAIFDTGNGVLYAAGQIGIDPETGKLAQGVHAQSMQALQNVAAIFEAAQPWAGSQFSLLNSSVCLVALASMNDYAEVNMVYAAAFQGAAALPARAAFQVAELPKGALVEMKCTGVPHQVVVATPNVPAAIGPYSQAIFDTANGVLYAAGQIGIDPRTGVLVQGVHAQTVQALHNAAAIFEAAQLWAGSQFGLLSAAECLVALANMSDYAEVNQAYAAAFDGADAFPARVAFQVAELPKAARVEIMCVGIGHRTAVATPNAPGAIGPYSQAIFDSTHGVLYAAGQIGLDPKSGALAADIATQAKQALLNVEAIFRAAPRPMSLLNVTECTVMLADMADYAQVNNAYAAAFESADAFPARVAFQVAALPKAALVEVKCTGVIDGHNVIALPSNTRVTSEEIKKVIV